jgi:hypothetical protein
MLKYAYCFIERDGFNHLYSSRNHTDIRWLTLPQALAHSGFALIGYPSTLLTPEEYIGFCEAEGSSGKKKSRGGDRRKKKPEEGKRVEEEGGGSTEPKEIRVTDIPVEHQKILLASCYQSLRFLRRRRGMSLMDVAIFYTSTDLLISS